MSVIGFCIALGSALGCPELDGESVTLIASGCTTLSAYIIGEGIADAAHTKKQENNGEK